MLFKWSGMRRLLQALLVTLLAVPMAAVALVFSFQDRLIFHPQPLAPAARATIASSHPQSEWIELVVDGVAVTAWLVRPAAARRDVALPLLMFFGGNGQDVSQMLDYAVKVPTHAWLIVAYRGYGPSGGQPSEAALFADALQFFDHAVKRPDLDARRISVMGYSLGSGVATYLASARPVYRTVLLTPFDSVAALAKRQFPWLPVDWLLRHRFDSLSRAPLIETPLLCAAAERDQVIPMDHTKRLFEAWKGDKQWLLLENTDHVAINAPALWPAVARFLND
jgi:hypothetical protein